MSTAGARFTLSQERGFMKDSGSNQPQLTCNSLSDQWLAFYVRRFPGTVACSHPTIRKPVSSIPPLSPASVRSLAWRICTMTLRRV
jgi:hypothetical protein